MRATGTKFDHHLHNVMKNFFNLLLCTKIAPHQYFCIMEAFTNTTLHILKHSRTIYFAVLKSKAQPVDRSTKAPNLNDILFIHVGISVSLTVSMISI